jgi:hypothetical protein
MEFPVGLGGITLVLAAVVWLVAFVPGFTQRSQIAETSKYVRQQQRVSDQNVPITKDQQLRRLINSQRGFSILFGLNVLAAIGFGVVSVGNSALVPLAVFFGVIALLALLVSRAAANAASSLAGKLHSNRLAVRAKASRSSNQTSVSRDWTPNPIPAPLSARELPEVVEIKIADVIEISKQRRTLSSSEIDQILARRRAI